MAEAMVAAARQQTVNLPGRAPPPWWSGRWPPRSSPWSSASPLSTTSSPSNSTSIHWRRSSGACPAWGPCSPRNCWCTPLACPSTTAPPNSRLMPAWRRFPRLRHCFREPSACPPIPPKTAAHPVDGRVHRRQRMPHLPRLLREETSRRKEPPPSHTRPRPTTRRLPLAAYPRPQDLHPTCTHGARRSLNQTGLRRHDQVPPADPPCTPRSTGVTWRLLTRCSIYVRLR